MDGLWDSSLLAARTFVVTRNLAHVLSLLILVVVVAGFHLLMRSSSSTNSVSSTGVTEAVRLRRRGIKALVIGTDGRASTSKTQVVLWTAAVLYALLFLLLWGRSIGCDAPANDRQDACKAAAEARGAFAAMMDRGLQPTYYVVLGFPLTAALAAKAMTQAKVADGTLRKPDLEQTPKGGVSSGLAEIVSNDGGESDLMDFQYFAFNLVTLGFFLLEFIPNPAGGLPDLPPALLSLAGLSTASYTTKKALEHTPDDEARRSAAGKKR